MQSDYSASKNLKTDHLSCFFIAPLDKKWPFKLFLNCPTCLLLDIVGNNCMIQFYVTLNLTQLYIKEHMTFAPFTKEWPIPIWPLAKYGVKICCNWGPLWWWGLDCSTHDLFSVRKIHQILIHLDCYVI